MYAYRLSRPQSHRRRAVVAVQVGIMTVVLLGFAALTVDLGGMFNVRGDLQRTADAAAMAGASFVCEGNVAEIRSEAIGFAKINPTLGTSTTRLRSEDIQVGWLDLRSPTATILSAPPADSVPNAVGVLARREFGEESNGPVRFFFAPIFGRYFGETSAYAVAVSDDRITCSDFAGLMPFTIEKNIHDYEVANGQDQYGYNEDSKTVYNSPDGIREVRLYPYPHTCETCEEGDGNFGILNIGIENQGANPQRDQILYGVTADQLQAEIGTRDLVFSDSSGNSVTYDITGNPGLTATHKDTIKQIVGQIVGYFLHEKVVLSGSNAIYTITDIRFGRLMDVRLTGAPKHQGVFVQPIDFDPNRAECSVDPNVIGLGCPYGRILLAR